MQATIWDVSGKDTNYEHYRKSSRANDLRNWVNDAYYNQGLAQYLDKDFLHALRNVDFFGRLWELELCEWLAKTQIEMIPTGNAGFDFCLKLPDGRKVWIEASLSNPDDDLKQIAQNALASNGALYNTPRNETALRYNGTLQHKAKKIQEKYLDDVADNDTVLIAVSAYPPTPGMWSSIDMFLEAVLPIGNPVIHVPRNGKTLDPSIERPTHELVPGIIKKSGAEVNTEFIYPGDEYPFVDGVIFSEASNLQMLLGSYSSNFGDETNTPHTFQNYSGKPLPKVFTKHFYHHKWVKGSTIMQLVMEPPE